MLTLANNTRNQSAYSNNWGKESEYDDNESMRSTKKFTQAKNQAQKRLGWPSKNKRTIITGGKKTLSKNM